MLRGKRERRKK